MTRPELWLYQEVVVAQALEARKCDCEKPKTRENRFCEHFVRAYNRLSELSESAYYKLSN